jgi:hypothetical protein
VTFVREPLERVISEFKHFVRHHGYDGTVTEFCSRPVMQNQHSKLLEAVPLEAIGFVGLTERYDEGIELINSKFSWSVLVRRDNVSNHFPNNEACQPSESEGKELEQLNQKGRVLYHQCTELFDKRYRIHQYGLQFCHARIQQPNDKQISVWAWWEGGSDKPVEIELLLNGKPAQIKFATDLRPSLCWFYPPRGGHIGFSFSKAAKEGDTVQWRIRETG